jgi:hypothetical protein
MAANVICHFFLAYCIVDATACAILYPDQESIGFAHHAGYAALLVHLIYTGRQVLFAIFAIEELPTLFLSVYELRGDTRPRLPTGLAIFSMRMVCCLYQEAVPFVCIHLNAPAFCSQSSTDDSTFAHRSPPVSRRTTFM